MFKVGDKVRILPSANRRYAGLYTVEKVNPTKYKLRPADGRVFSGTGLLNTPHSLVSAADATEAPAEHPAAHASFRLGQFVTVQGDRRIKPTTLFVVLKPSLDKTNIVQAGGSPSDPNRYWRMPNTFLRVVDTSAALTDAWLED